MDNSKIRPTRPKQQQTSKPQRVQAIRPKTIHTPDRLIVSKDGKKTLVMGSKMESTVTQEYADKMLREKGVFLL